MKLSTRGRYGLKAMVDLALAYGNGPVSTASLAAQQGISDAYLEQLIGSCLLYTSPSPRDPKTSRMPASA